MINFLVQSVSGRWVSRVTSSNGDYACSWRKTNSCFASALLPISPQMRSPIRFGIVACQYRSLSFDPYIFAENELKANNKFPNTAWQIPTTPNNSFSNSSGGSTASARLQKGFRPLMCERQCSRVLYVMRMLAYSIVSPTHRRIRIFSY